MIFEKRCVFGPGEKIDIGVEIMFAEFPDYGKSEDNVTERALPEDQDFLYWFHKRKIPSRPTAAQYNPKKKNFPFFMIDSRPAMEI